MSEPRSPDADGRSVDEAHPAPVDERGTPAAEAREPAAVDEGRRALATWLWRLPVLAALGGAVYGAREVYRVHFGKIPPTPDPRYSDRAPVEVAPLAHFAAPWEAAPFMLDGLPCMALRLPSPVAGSLTVTRGDDALHLIAFSRICTHQACLIDLTRDTEAIAFAFNHRTDRPQLTCACHYSVFDPLRAGRVASGPAVRPLPRARLAVVGESNAATVVADGIELDG
jgi:arsenite oxidase small subunit